MSLPPAPPRAQAFFLQAGAGQRFCLYHAAAGTPRGAVLYVHPFAEEMNKARRMAALQARALAAAGYAVLQIDLLGCGDSSGDFGDARWDAWKQDLALAAAWLRDRTGAPVSLWGLRLGALLALDYAHGTDAPLDRLVLWAPVTSGSQFLTQFLRLRMANDMLGEGATNGTRTGTAALRDTLRGGEVLEVAGYDIAPALADALDALDASQLAPVGRRVHWFEVVGGANRGLTPAAAGVVDAWTAAGAQVHTHLISTLPFWATQEITECPPLVDATTAVFTGARDGS